MPGVESIPAAAIGLAKTAVSLVNAGKTKKLAKELERTRPEREISPLYGQNLSLAESELAGGMGAAAERAYNNQLEKAMSGSLSAILRGGGSVNNVADVFASGEEGRQRLALINDQLRLNQINNVIRAREMSAEEADKNFIFNDWMPWKDKAAANAQARKDANAGIWSGLETLTGAATNFLSGGLGEMGGDSGSAFTGVSPNSGRLPSAQPNPSNFEGSPATTFGNTIPYRPAQTVGTNYVQQRPNVEYPIYNSPFYFGG